MAIGEWKVKVSADMASVKNATRDLKVEMKKAGDSIEKDVGDRGTKSVSKLTKAFEGLKGLLFAGGLIGAIVTLGNVLKQSFVNFVAFEKGLARINTVANVSKKEMRGLGKEIKIISETYGLAKDELLETGFNISSAGVEFKNVSKIMELSAITAVGAGTDTTTAFNGIIAVIKKYGENINIAGDIAEKFFIANKLGQTTIEDMAIAMQNLTSSAKPAGVSINEVFAVVATLTGVTGNANQVITQLNGAISALASPTKEARKLFDKLGIEVGQATIKEKGFATVATEVFEAVDGNTEALRQLIPEVEAQKLIVAIATTQNEKYKLSLDEVTTGQGNLEEAVRKMSNTTDFKLKVSGKKWENFKTSTGNVLVTVSGYLIDFGRIVVSVFNIFGKVIDQGINAILSLTKITGSSLADVVGIFEEFMRVIPNLVKQGLNNLPGIMSAGIRSMLNIIPGGLGDTFADKLGLDSFGAIFKDVDTDFSFKNTKRAFGEIVDDAVGINNDIAKEWGKITDTFTGNSKEQQLAIKETIDGIEEMNQSFGDDTINKLNKRMDDLNEKLRDTKIGTDEYKKLTKELKEVEKKLFDAGKEARSLDEIMGDSGETGKDASDKVKKSLTALEKEYKDIEKQIDANIKAQKEYAEDSKDFNKDILNDVRAINKELEDRKTTLENEIKIIEGDTRNILAERGLEVSKEQLSLQEDIAEATKDNTRFASLQLKLKRIDIDLSKNLSEEKRKEFEEDRLDILQKIEDRLIAGNNLSAEEVDFKEKIVALEKEAKVIKESVTEEDVAEVKRVEGLSEAEKAIEAEKVQKEKVQAEFDLEKQKLDELLKINKVFLQLKKLDEEGLNEFMASERFKEFSTDEQNLILKLANERIKLTQQNEFIISEQQRIADKTRELSIETTAIQISNLDDLQDEYASLIEQIDNAISKQKTLNSLKGGDVTATTGFASGGFTGNGGTNEVAGVVHGGEWVAPKWMVNDLKPLFNDLEGQRSKGFASGGNTTTNNKTQNNTINVGGGNFDAQQFLDYAKWKL